LLLVCCNTAAVNKSTAHPKITKISNTAFGPIRDSSHQLKISLTTSTTPIAAKYQICSSHASKQHLSVCWFSVVSVVLCRAPAVSLGCSRCFGVDWVLFFEVRCFMVDLCCSSMARGGSRDSCLFLRCLAVSWSCFGISCSQ
jgi:hypothetical protein